MRRDVDRRPRPERPRRATLLVLVTALAASCAAPRPIPTALEPVSEVNEPYYEVTAGQDPVDRWIPIAPRARSAPARNAPPVLVGSALRCDASRDCVDARPQLSERAEQLRACYEAAGAEAAGRGVVYALLDVQPAGDVSGALVGYSAVHGTAFADCLDRELGAVSMPPSPSASAVQVLLVFGARDQAEGRRMLAAYRAARRSSAHDRPVPVIEIGQSVQGCYERAFRGHETEPEQIVLRVTVREDGRVVGVEIVEDAFDGRLDECIVDSVGKLRLLLDERTRSTFVIPVVLQPGSGPGAPADALTSPRGTRR